MVCLPNNDSEYLARIWSAKANDVRDFSMSDQPLSEPVLPAKMTAADYIRWIERNRPNEETYQHVRVVAQSPSSPAGRLLMNNLELFARLGFKVLAVFTKTRSKADVVQAVEAYDKAFGRGRSESRMRFASFSRKNEVRELLDIGKAAARLDKQVVSLDELDVVSIVPDAQTEFARKFAFDAVWSISAPVETLR